MVLRWSKAYCQRVFSLSLHLQTRYASYFFDWKQTKHTQLQSITSICSIYFFINTNVLDLSFPTVLPSKALFFVPFEVTITGDDLKKETLLASPGSFGTVLGEYSDTRLIVVFDQRQDGREEAEIILWDSPWWFHGDIMVIYIVYTW